MGLTEKVLLGLACCLPEKEEDAEQGCSKCPYNDQCGDADQDVMVRVQIIEDIRNVLKKQEPQKMKNIVGTAVSAMGECPSCGRRLNTSFLPGQIKTKFCYNCGQAVKWNG